MTFFIILLIILILLGAGSGFIKDLISTALGCFMALLVLVAILLILFFYSL